MVLKDMYEGLVNSPETKITIGLSDVDTTMTVDNIAAIPAAPNLLTIGGDTENPETVKVISISGSVVTIERGFQGVARLWPIGTRVSRNFTEYDHNTFIENIKTLKTSTDENADDILELMSYVGSLDNLETVEKSNLVLALNEIYQGLVAHKAEKATEVKLGHIRLSDIPNIDISGKLDKSGDTLESYREKLVTLSGTDPTIDLALSNVFTHTLSGNTTYSISNAQSQSHSFTLIITQPSTAYSVSFPASIKWMNEQIPDLSTVSKTYYLIFDTIDGGVSWHGRSGGMF